MPDNVETMAYTRADGVPWHGFGNPVDNNLTPEEMAKVAEINWGVEKRMLYQMIDGNPVVVPDHFSLTRTTDGKSLSIVGKLYQPIDNVRAVQFFSDYVRQGDMTMNTMGSLDGGRRIWGLAKMGQGFTLAGGDRVEGYLLLCSPHKQGEAFTVKMTSIRVVCQNTLTAAINGRANGTGATYRMSHARGFTEADQQEARETLGLAKSKLDLFKEQATLLSTTRVPNRQNVVDFVAQLSKSKLLESIVQADAAENEPGTSALEAILNVAEVEREVAVIRQGLKEADLNKAGKLMLDCIMDSPGSDLPSARGTYWGVLNGVTNAVDHHMGKSADSRMTSAWFGTRGVLKQKALDLATVYANDARVRV
ncbi:MAG: DUF932 domain-containing protein [Vulcanimicrobiaceae bacterium]